MAGASGHVDDPVGRDGAGAVVGAVMIDLGSELEGYDGSLPVRKSLPVNEAVTVAHLTKEEVEKAYGISLPQVDFPAAYTVSDLNGSIRTRLNGMRFSNGHRVPLRQLQAEGFNTTPPPDYLDRVTLHTSEPVQIPKIANWPNVGDWDYINDAGKPITVRVPPNVGESGTPTPSPPT